MMRLLLLTVLCLWAVSAYAQPAELQLFDTWRLLEARTDTLGRGVATFAAGAGDTLEVFYNIRGEGALWEATYQGARWVRTLTAGTFEVTEEMATAYRVWSRQREQLEALYEIEVVRQALIDR